MMQQELILDKINTLSPPRISEVIDFIDFLSERENSRHKAERFSSIAEYAMANAGSQFDLDVSLEQAGIDSFLAIDEAKS
jgi:hypothetical protein